MPNNSLGGQKHSNYVITFSMVFYAYGQGPAPALGHCGWFVIMDRSHPHTHSSGFWHIRRVAGAGIMATKNPDSALCRPEVGGRGGTGASPDRLTRVSVFLFGGVARGIAPQRRVHMMICSFYGKHLRFCCFFFIILLSFDLRFYFANS